MLLKFSAKSEELNKNKLVNCNSQLPCVIPSTVKDNFDHYKAVKTYEIHKIQSEAKEPKESLYDLRFPWPCL
jgi:chromatin remodeling complex protein RSC6